MQKYRGADLEDFLLTYIDENSNSIVNKLRSLHKNSFLSSWSNAIRSAEEVINFRFEINFSETELNSVINQFPPTPDSMNKLKPILDKVEKQLGIKSKDRLFNLLLMGMAIQQAYKLQKLPYLEGATVNFSTLSGTADYCQSRRSYLTCILPLINDHSQGTEKLPKNDCFNQLLYFVDTCFVGITSAYRSLLLNECYDDFEIESNGTYVKPNYSFDPLEALFLEPQRLTLMDQLEFNSKEVEKVVLPTKPSNTIFHYQELKNCISHHKAIYKGYKIDDVIEFKELENLVSLLEKYCIDNYHIKLTDKEWKGLGIDKYKINMNLIHQKGNVLEAINGIEPFIKADSFYYSTVNKLTRYISITLYNRLIKKRRFQIKSGFIFEDKAMDVLASQGFKDTKITRIDHKEFDLITIKNGKVYNFQCKNNLIDISSVSLEYKKIGRYNRRLIRYYEKALIKEENREHLISKKTGINDIEHYVISRFPVITKNKRIINFNSLQDWLKENH